MAVGVSLASRSSGKYWAGGNYAAAQTNLALVADPGDGYTIYIDFVHITTAAANTIELRDGSGGTAVYRSVYAAAGSENVTLPIGIGITSSTGLYLNTTYAGAHQVLVLYHIENTLVS